MKGFPDVIGAYNESRFQRKDLYRSTKNSMPFVKYTIFLPQFVSLYYEHFVKSNVLKQNYENITCVKQYIFLYKLRKHNLSSEKNKCIILYENHKPKAIGDDKCCCYETVV